MVLFCLLESDVKAQNPQNFGQDRRNDMQAMIENLSYPKRFSVDDAASAMASLNEMREIVPSTGLRISENERIEILKAMDMKKGHWFKCKNGKLHFRQIICKSERFLLQSRIITLCAVKYKADDRNQG